MALVSATPASPVRIGEEFRPAQQLRSLYYVYLLLTAVVAVAPWLLPLVLATSLWISLLIAIPTLAVLLLVAVWIPLYYASEAYRLTPTEIYWKRGVWFRQTGIVPYTKITNIDIIQGPLMRSFRISTLKVQTAGYSGQNATAEIRLNGIEDPEQLRDLILTFVRGRKGVEISEHAVGQAPIDERILQELREMRRLLEKISGK